MSTPRDRDGFDDDDTGRAWQDPTHLGGDDADRPQPPATGPAAGGSSWEPPGWNLPAASTDRDQPAPADPSAPPTAAPERPRGGLFGSRRPRDPEMERAFTYEGDQLGAPSWALQHGWTISDGSRPGGRAAARAPPAAARGTPPCRASSRPRRCAPARRRGPPACSAAGPVRWSSSPS